MLCKIYSSTSTYGKEKEKINFYFNKNSSEIIND